MRGEKFRALRSSSVMSGSPPHARGKAGKYRPVSPLAGITPACAGKRRVIAGDRGGLEDHPRMRGEKKGDDTTTRSGLGSPPHARGKVLNSSS